jgi:dipeptidase E
VAERQIVALGGGGFLEDDDDGLLDDFVLSLTGKERPRVCFVPTAGGDRDASIVDFYAAFGGGRAEPSHLALFRRRIDDVAGLLADQDVVYVGGGNTENMLAVWRLHGVDRALRAAWDAGVVLAGMSAGSLCWFETGTTDSFGPRLERLGAGLGFLPGSNCPHYDGEAARRPTYHRLVAEGMPGGYAADDWAALHFVGTRLREAVAARPAARAYRVELRDGAVVETELPTRYLGRS